MNYSRTVRDGAGRDEALKRRNGAAGDVLGMGTKPKPDMQKPAQAKAEEKPSE